MIQLECSATVHVKTNAIGVWLPIDTVAVSTVVPVEGSHVCKELAHLVCCCQLQQASVVHHCPATLTRHCLPFAPAACELGPAPPQLASHSVNSNRLQ